MVKKSKTDAKLLAEEPAIEGGFRPKFKPAGSSGTDVTGGYFAEEYLQKLRGSRGAKIWDEMARSEPQIAMLLGAICNPIKSATWDIESAPDVENGEMHEELVKRILMEDIDWEAFLNEALTMVRSGFSLFEVTHAVVSDDPKFGQYNGLKELGFRSQKTIERWNLERGTGKILSVTQEAYTDIGDVATMDGRFLLVFTLGKEGANYEGVSLLRPMYGPWVRKNLYLKLCAIGLEKYAVGTPVGTVPAGKEGTDEFEKFKTLLQNFTSHESAYLIKPEGWEVDIVKADFDGSKIKDILTFENTEMVNAAMANFLALGMNSSGGSRALGLDLSDFFMFGLNGFASIICGVINRDLIPSLVRMNFGPQSAYPKLKCTGVQNEAGEELARVIQMLTGSNQIKPDMKTEEFLRKLYRLPAPDIESREAAKVTSPGVPPPPPGQAKEGEPVAETPDPEEEEDSAKKLDEAYRKRFDNAKDGVKSTMQEGLAAVYGGLKKKLKTAWNGATPSSRALIAAKVEAPGFAQYRNLVREDLAEVANAALAAARREVPGAKNVKLAESIQLAAPRGGYFNALPPKVKKLVQAQATLIAQTQIADLEKIALFQFSSSATGTDSLDQIFVEMDQAVLPVIDGSTKTGMSVDAAASNAVANASNQARMEFFMEPEVLGEIESFTFTNEDPVSPICQELNGVTWAAGDADIDKYGPPLHHNCKSRLVPNLKGDKGNPKVANGTPLTQKALDAITLCESLSGYGLKSR